MSTIGKVLGCERVSLALAVTALLALATALAAVRLSGQPAIPDRLTDCVRGANPAYWRAGNPNGGNCTSWNVYIANSAGDNYVTFYNCTQAGQTCISCALQNNYVLKLAPGNPACYPKPIGVISCNNASGSGAQGTCTMEFGSLMCDLTGNYDCDQYALTYNLE